ncbi:hypothetical protein K1T71_000483 [Dendrolimus kikuchii]|uniref:Uncharacterized protein n=1 Tax=Dendrolimus kikuchii TaxID=765133 RepID=A0ACC1DJU8_9NEOP|nr:hypothetical protein K1T71_000483 [Dendrolimus kikuchii]
MNERRARPTQWPCPELERSGEAEARAALEQRFAYNESPSKCESRAPSTSVDLFSGELAKTFRPKLRTAVRSARATSGPTQCLSALSGGRSPPPPRRRAAPYLLPLAQLQTNTALNTSKNDRVQNISKKGAVGTQRSLEAGGRRACPAAAKGQGHQQQRACL